MLRKTKKLVRIALIVLLILIFSFSLYQIISTICHYSESEETYKDIVANVVTIKDADDINEQEGEKIEQAPIAVDFDALYRKTKTLSGGSTVKTHRLIILLSKAMIMTIIFAGC